MNIAPINPEFDASKPRAQAEAKSKKRLSLFSERAYIVQANLFDTPPAPQGIGETKHHAVDEEDNRISHENEALIATVYQTSDPGPEEQAHRHLRPELHKAEEARQAMEAYVRSAKWSGKRCPYCNKKNHCSRPYIRCGDRAQFSSRESEPHQLMPHFCNYRPGEKGDHVLIVSADTMQGQFSKNAIALFMPLDYRKIEAVESANAAIASLKRAKIEGRRVGLIISDIKLPDKSGYELTNELFDRNFLCDIVLVQEENDTSLPPSRYMGNREIVPGRSLVSTVLAKPFHSSSLIAALKRMREE